MKSIYFPAHIANDMVRSILAGRKTVTRRVVKPHYRENEIGFQIITNSDTGEYVRIEYYDEWENDTRIMADPYHPGEILYVREATWKWPVGYEYKADYPDDDNPGYIWTPSIHMPREAARIFLWVMDVRVERLQDMPPYDIAFEGFRKQKDFIALWNRTIKPADRALYGWDANPFVWVIEFERINKEESTKNVS